MMRSIWEKSKNVIFSAQLQPVRGFDLNVALFLCYEVKAEKVSPQFLDIRTHFQKN